MTVYTRNNKLIFLLILSKSTFAADFTIEEKLGEKLFKDINLSIQRNQSCESCHSLSRKKCLL